MLSVAAPNYSSQPVMNVLSSENCGVNILPDGGTFSQFITDKIQELSLRVSVTGNHRH